MKAFYISILHDRKRYRLRVDQLYSDAKKEGYKISSRHHSFSLESNRPLWRNKNLKHHRPTWKIVAGSPHNASLVEKIIESIMQAIDK